MTLLSTSQVYHHNAIFSIIQSIKFCILNVYLPSEATRLKTISITFVARIMETGAPSIVLKTRTCLWACDTYLLADVIVFYTTRREHFAIYASLGEDF